MTPFVATRVFGAPSHRRIRWSSTAVYALCALYALVVLVASIAPALRFPAVGVGLLVFGLVALYFAIRAATQRTLPRKVRRAWGLLGVGLLVLNLIPVAIALAGKASYEGASNSFAAPPTVVDLLRLVAYLPLLGALMMFPRGDTSRRDGHKLLLDVVTVIGGSFMLIWYFVLGPALTSPLPVLTMIVATAYPITDLTLIFGAAVVVLRGLHASIRRPMITLLGGLGMIVVADSYLGYSKLHPYGDHYPLLQLGLLMTGLFLMGLAGRQQCQLAVGSPATEQRRMSRPLVRLPYVALAAGSVLLIVEALRSGVYPWSGLIAGAVVMTAAVTARQIIAMRENHHMIISDSLTGLSNRARLHDVLRRAVDRANHLDERTAVMLIDMDGFKQVNDTLGHAAGDQLLRAFANLLRASVLGRDIVARLGGDEFAIVLHNVGSSGHPGAVAARILAGMQEPVAVNGKLICPAASIGIAVTEPGHPVLPTALLHRADMAMYRAKAIPGNAYVFSDEALERCHTE